MVVVKLPPPCILSGLRSVSSSSRFAIGAIKDLMKLLRDNSQVSIDLFRAIFGELPLKVDFMKLGNNSHTIHANLVGNF